MNRLKEVEGADEPLNPADYFHIIAGTGTGGVSACMLGRLGMSLDQAMTAYVKLVSGVFSDKKVVGTSTPSAYKGAKLREQLKLLVKSATGSESERMMAGKDNLCKAMVFAMSKHNLSASIPVIFRSYESTVNPAPDCTIWEALYATMAHPDLFKSIEISDGHIQQSFVGGELGCSNPIQHVLSEVKHLYPGRHASCILSIGAGHARTIRLPDLGPPRWLLNTEVVTAIKDMATDSERVAEEMASRFQDSVGVYYRFNVDQGIQDTSASGWENLGEVKAHTQAYIGKVESNGKIDQASDGFDGPTTQPNEIPFSPTDGRVHIHLDERPVRIKRCPAPSSVFTGREDYIQQVGNCIVDGNRERRVCVVHGLGGAGKTQLALKTVERHRDNWVHVLYVDASSREVIETTLQDFAQAKCIGKTYEDTLGWLETCHEPWLLVYDNADHPSLKIHEYFPSGSRGSIIITSRLSGMRVHATGPGSDCHILHMHHEDALALLYRLARISGESLGESEAKAADTLIEDFGYLALAIVHAGAYIGHSHIPISQYRDLFLVHRRSILERYSTLKVQIDSYQRSVFTTWELCYDLLERSGGSRPLLWMIAHMHHSYITPSIFERASISIQTAKPLFTLSQVEIAARDHVQKFLSRFLSADGAWDWSLFSDTINELESYSLIEFDRANGAYTIHVLVQEWARTVTPQSPELALECATTLLAYAIDLGHSTEAHKSRIDLGLHVIKLLSGQEHSVRANHAPSFARVFEERCMWGQKETLELRLKNETHTILGAEHPETLQNLNNLASTYWELGRWDEAEELFSKVLEARSRLLGEEHHSTLDTMAFLAITYGSQGRWEKAEELKLKVLDRRNRSLGGDHPDTLASMSSLAFTYSIRGRWADAEELQAKTLSILRRVLGEEHPDTLLSASNLATVYGKQGKLDDAEKLQLVTWKIRRRMRGEEHPETLTIMSCLASTYHDQGRCSKAEGLHAKVYEARQRLLGEEHPDTITSMCGLARTYWKQGRWSDAEQLEVKALEIRRRTLGEGHPKVLLTMNDLACTYRDQGRWTEAEKLDTTVLERYRRELGEEHPDTLTSMNNLANTYKAQGRWDEAEELFVRVTESLSRIMGAEHPYTIKAGNSLVVVRQSRLNGKFASWQFKRLTRSFPWRSSLLISVAILFAAYTYAYVVSKF